MKKILFLSLCYFALLLSSKAQSFSAGNLVVLQTSGTLSKASSPITLKEYTTGGIAGISVSLPSTGTNPIQTAGIFGGSEGFLTTSTDGKYLVVGGYGTAASYTDITSTASSSVARVIGTVAPSGFYLQVASSNTFFSGNDIRGAVSDGTNYWASGASAASIDGINYFGLGTPSALATGTTPPKAYGLRIFNSQLYYSTQKSGPTNTSSQLGIFAVGTGLPTSGTVTVSQVINTGTIVPQDFSFNAAGDVCYVAVSLNTSSGGIQKWTKSSGGVWGLAYTLGTGVTNIGTYGLVVDYSGSNPIIYATTFESTGNRIIKIIDNGTLASSVVSTIVPATTNVYFKGISFAPVSSGTPIVNLTISADTASEAAKSVITITANSSAVLTSAQTVSIAVSGTGITTGDYTLSSSTITIPASSSSASITFTVKDDILGEGTEVAKITMKSPSSGIVLGIDSIKTITIADNDGNNFPQIIINTDSTTNYIDGAAKVSPTSPFTLSGVINNPSDPASSLGISFLVTDLETISTDISLNIKSSDTNVVSLSGIVVNGIDSIRNIKITPKTVGYADITLTVSDGKDSTSYLLKYAASIDTLLTLKSVWHTGMSDASAAVALDTDYYVAGDDELNYLNVYSRKNSGLPLKTFEYSVGLGLDPLKPEVDVEAVAPSIKIPNRVYWLGSMSNSKSPFEIRPNRDRIFATTIAGSGSSTTISFVGYTSLRNHIIAWGDANGYNFSASAAAGVDSKLPNGFAAEGMVMGPDSSTLYIGLRAPLVPVTARNKALIVPIKNFESWFNNGTPSGAPNFSAPIELNLGGRAIRDLIKLNNGTYIIIAGSCGSSPLAGAIYKWTGKPSDSAILVTSSYTNKLNIEGALQASNISASSSLQLITDNGDDVFYADGIVAKDFGTLPLRKFRSVILDSLDLTMMSTAIKPINSENNLSQFVVYPNPSNGLFSVRFLANSNEVYKIIITDLQGKKLYEKVGASIVGENKIMADVNQFPKGIYLIQLSSSSRFNSQKIILE